MKSNRYQVIQAWLLLLATSSMFGLWQRDIFAGFFFVSLTLLVMALVAACE
jgi:hypothetical protein